MVSKHLCVLVLWTKVASALAGFTLARGPQRGNVRTNRRCQNHTPIVLFSIVFKQWLVSINSLDRVPRIETWINRRITRFTKGTIIILHYISYCFEQWLISINSSDRGSRNETCINIRYTNFTKKCHNHTCIAFFCFETIIDIMMFILLFERLSFRIM